MGKRREGREAAIQFLFSHDLNKDLGRVEAAAFWDLRHASPSVRSFAETLIDGVRAHHEAIDAELRGASENFTLEELGAVERSILRVAVHELMNVKETPSAVAINEAIEIGKRFGGTESARFINGILDRIRRDRESSQA